MNPASKRTNVIRVRFDNVGGGLATRDGQPLNWFEISGSDKHWQKADAKIDGDSVLVSNPGVSAPVSVRFAWDQTPTANLTNKEGLPASAFCTDFMIK